MRHVQGSETESTSLGPTVYNVSFSSTSGVRVRFKPTKKIQRSMSHGLTVRADIEMQLL